mgnify:CR=1 FL=1|tara:strand:+ start:4860 stop:5123 length:264 start_codon:yes stop_codon:yes gene_type:complete
MSFLKKLSILISLSIFIPTSIFAAGDADVLATAVSTLTTQLKGPGKSLIYTLEGVTGVYTYMQTRNWVNLAGIGIVFLFTSVLFSIV